MVRLLEVQHKVWVNDNYPYIEADMLNDNQIPLEMMTEVLNYVLATTDLRKGTELMEQIPLEHIVWVNGSNNEINTPLCAQNLNKDQVMLEESVKVLNKLILMKNIKIETEGF